MTTKSVTMIIVLGVVLGTGCEGGLGGPPVDRQSLNLCIATAREQDQVEDEIPQFLAYAETHSDEWGVGLESLSCDNLPDSVKDRIRAVDGFVHGDGWTVIRASSGDLEMILKQDHEYIDAVWGYGISYILSLDNSGDGQDLFLEYRPSSTPQLLQAIEQKRRSGKEQWRWFLDQEFMDRYQDGQDATPVYFGVTAYMNVLCVNHDKLVGTRFAGQEEFEWADLLEDPELQGRLAMPRLDTSGTGLIAAHALSEYLGGSRQDVIDALVVFAEAQGVSFTRSGGRPCELAADPTSTVAIGISNGSKLRELQSADGAAIKVRPGWIASGVGFEIEANAMVNRTDGMAPVDRYVASRFLDWASSEEAMDIYAGSSEVVSYPVVQNASSGICPADCEDEWADLDYSDIPNSKVWLQVDFAQYVCETAGSPCED